MDEQVPRLPDGQLGDGNGAFVAFFCRDIQPYLAYDDAIDGARDRRIPRVLLLHRWDGWLGFPGGFCDGGETPLEAAVREVREELGFAVAPERLDFLATHGSPKFASHCFACETAPDEFRTIVRGLVQARHAEAETCGFATPNVERRAGGGIDVFMRSPMIFSVRQELDLLIRRYGLLADASPAA